MWSYRNPVDVRFGRGSFSRLADAIGGRRYALVTYGDAYFRGLAATLEKAAGAPLFTIDDIAPNPDIALLKLQTARFSRLSRQPEVIVALGGGSVIDSAKVFAAARGDFAAMDDYLKKRTGVDTIVPWPLIAVPTKWRQSLKRSKAWQAGTRPINPVLTATAMARFFVSVVPTNCTAS